MDIIKVLSDLGSTGVMVAVLYLILNQQMQLFRDMIEGLRADMRQQVELQNSNREQIRLEMAEDRKAVSELRTVVENNTHVISALLSKLNGSESLLSSIYSVSKKGE